jgi:DmsE family decaheme c-type cytochrome
MRSVLLLLLAISARAQTAGSGFVGSDVCKTCHSDVWANFYKNPHFKSIAAGNLPPARTGCEGCHGPGQAHVDAGGGQDTIPRAFSLMKPAQILNACLTCHANDFSKANIRRSSHTEADVVCTNCHSIHKAATPKFLLARKQTDLCFSCHPDIRGQFEMPVKHRVNEGFMQCSDCHNPHGTFAPTWNVGQRPRMVEQGPGSDEICVKCHADTRGPFAFEHPPVHIEGCETCHIPHGSMNTRLLRRPVIYTLCLECHNGAGTFGREGTGVIAPLATHNLFDARFRNCTACHVRIHGSNADPNFLR